ncbi:MAG TPA: diguanylate cyclase [bacterium]|nr:diguanylate cyclase [bacterium]
MSKILIVDDSPDNVAMCALILAKDEHTILTASNGHDALRIAKEERPDVVLLDILMPDLDGFEVCKQLKADPATADISVLLLTAYHRDAESLAHGLSLGADDYITKPFNSAELRARVKVMARLKHHLDALVERNTQLSAANHALEEANHRLQETQHELEELAVTDPLTGLYNRRYLIDRLQELFSLVGRQPLSLHLLMFDLDHFKHINDTYGHAAGDQVLVQFADVLRKSVRRADIVARIGGEEFMVAMMNTPAERAEQAAERIRQTVERQPMRAEGTPIMVATSVGMASLPDHPGPEHTLEKLMQAADVALYQAKERGRNRLVVAKP